MTSFSLNRRTITPVKGVKTRVLQLDVGFSFRFYRALAVLLSNRLRGTVSQLGYGKLQLPSEDDEAVELSDLSDNVALATARFDWLLRRLQGS